MIRMNPLIIYRTKTNNFPPPNPLRIIMLCNKINEVKPRKSLFSSMTLKYFTFPEIFNFSNLFYHLLFSCISLITGLVMEN